jgi:competence ComEA-like helix-hairpin-helix protein
MSMNNWRAVDFRAVDFRAVDFWVSNFRAIVFMALILLLCSQWATAAEQTGAAVDVAATTNINEDDAHTMATVLEGIGLHKAEAIVAYREQNGRFYLIEELTAVKGIGKSLVQRNADKIVLDNTAGAATAAVNSM